MSKTENIDLKINELDLEILQPNSETFVDPNQGGCKHVIIGKPGCFAKDTEVLLYNGALSKVQDIRVGDVIMGDDSTPRHVLELCSQVEQMYTIHPSHSDKVVVNKEHILVLYNSIDKTVITITVSDFIQKSKQFKQNHKWISKIVQFRPQTVPEDPYYVGVWLTGKPNVKNIFNDKFLQFLNEYNLLYDRRIPDVYM